MSGVNSHAILASTGTASDRSDLIFEKRDMRCISRTNPNFWRASVSSRLLAFTFPLKSRAADLHHHKIQGNRIFPAASFLEGISSIQGTLSGKLHESAGQDVVFMSPISLELHDYLTFNLELRGDPHVWCSCPGSAKSFTATLRKGYVCEDRTTREGASSCNSNLMLGLKFVSGKTAYVSAKAAKSRFSSPSASFSACLVDSMLHSIGSVQVGEASDSGAVPTGVQTFFCLQNIRGDALRLRCEVGDNNLLRKRGSNFRLFSNSKTVRHLVGLSIHKMDKSRATRSGTRKDPMNDFVSSYSIVWRTAECMARPAGGSKLPPSVDHEKMTISCPLREKVCLHPPTRRSLNSGRYLAVAKFLRVTCSLVSGGVLNPRSTDLRSVDTHVLKNVHISPQESFLWNQSLEAATAEGITGTISQEAMAPLRLTLRDVHSLRTGDVEVDSHAGWAAAMGALVSKRALVPLKKADQTQRITFQGRNVVPGTEEVMVMAVGLNFRDVLLLMGAMSKSSSADGAVGTDFSGIVCRNSELQRSIEPGRKVAGLMPGCTARFIVCISRLVYDICPNISSH